MEKIQINRKEYFIVRYAFQIIFLTSTSILIALYFLKIGQSSLLENVLDYYLKRP